MSINLLIWASYGELTGPEKLAVGLLPLAEPLYRPGKCVLHILTNFCPGNWKACLKTRKVAHKEQNLNGYFLHWKVLTDLHQDSLSMGGWMGASSSWLSRSSAILSSTRFWSPDLSTRSLLPLESPPFHQTPFPPNPFSSKPVSQEGF